MLKSFRNGSALFPKRCFFFSLTSKMVFGACKTHPCCGRTSLRNELPSLAHCLHFALRFAVTLFAHVLSGFAIHAFGFLVDAFRLLVHELSGATGGLHFTRRFSVFSRVLNLVVLMKHYYAVL